MEEATDKRTTWRPWKFISVEEMANPFPTRATDVSRQDVRRTWEVLEGPLEQHAGPHREGG
jgi:hypothetical protein